LAAIVSPTGIALGPIGLPSAAPPVVRNSEASWPMMRRLASCGNGQSRSSLAHPRLQVHDRDLAPERHLRGHRGRHPAAVDHHRGGIEVDEQLVDAGHEHRADRRRVGAGRLAEQDRDVGRDPEGLERLVHAHRVGTGGDGERADAVGVVERRRDGSEAGDLWAAAGDQQDVVVVVLNRERAQWGFHLGHARVLLGRGSWPYGAPSV
jgi:hypothetical protein